MKLIKAIAPVIIGFCIAGAVLYFIQPSIVSGASMEPSIHEKQVAITYNLAYKDSNPKYRDCVIAEYNNIMIIKRVIGIPGDTLEFKDGEVYKNGELLEETYIQGKTYSKTEKITLNKNEYFLMGDNRKASLDSRELGPFKKIQIQGKVIKII